MATNCFGAVPAWLYPLNPPGDGSNGVKDTTTLVHVPNSQLEFADAQLTDLYFAPDWHPELHSPMPAIVVHGRPPGPYACGYCHLPGGQGRPENAALAGLPAAYIIQQVAEIKSGVRGSAWHGGPYRPIDLMRVVATKATDTEITAAADYFSAQTLRPRVTVIDPGGGDEALGQRLIEWAPDPSGHENRDDVMLYSAFVPPGSVAHGRDIALKGRGDSTQACSNCHGVHLQGMGLIPPLAGRSPTYLMRQLVAFQTKDRAGAAAAPMQAVADKLQIADMIAVAAYAASQWAAAASRPAN